MEVGQHPKTAQELHYKTVEIRVLAAEKWADPHKRTMPTVIQQFEMVSMTAVFGLERRPVQVGSSVSLEQLVDYCRHIVEYLLAVVDIFAVVAYIQRSLDWGGPFRDLLFAELEASAACIEVRCADLRA